MAKTTAKREQIGIVTILRDRAYDKQEMYVQAGEYPIVCNGRGQIGFELTGWKNTPAGRFKRLERGSSIFTMASEDRPDTRREVTFYPRWWTRDEWEEFMQHEQCQPGPAQRLIINIGGEDK